MCPTGGGNRGGGYAGSGSYQSGNGGPAGFTANKYRAAYCYAGCVGPGGAAVSMPGGGTSGKGGDSRSNGNGFAGDGGAVRIIWPGTCRQFPSTRVSSE